MRQQVARATCLFVLILSLVLIGYGQNQNPSLVGSWDGTWDSIQGTSGSFTMTIEEKAAGGLGGKMVVSSGGAEMYTAELKTVALEGKGVRITYDSPDGQAEILVEGELVENKVAGKWKVKIPGQELIEAGSWQATRK